MFKLPNGWRKWPEDRPKKDGQYVWLILKDPTFSHVMIVAKYIDATNKAGRFKLWFESMPTINPFGPSAITAFGEEDVLYWQPYSVPASPDVFETKEYEDVYVESRSIVHQTVTKPKEELNSKAIWMCEV